MTAVAIGAITGIRSMAAPALLSFEVREMGDADEFGPLERILSSKATPRILAVLAGGEMLADKTDVVPDRTSAVPLLGRATIGAVTAAAYAVQRREPVGLPALVGAVSAIASTFAIFHLRRLASERYKIPDTLFGFAEDAIVLGASKLVANSIEEH